ncbi:MAG: hypothetical protein KatS3mg111_1322 [Pirellulaceae bacterium]|nr:MAG: hypothetical protein KatS3mg111_1322 [Pirellulaceae bacterium]
MPKASTASRQAIDGRCIGQGIAVTPQGTRWLIIGKEEDDIWWLLPPLIRLRHAGDGPQNQHAPQHVEHATTAPLRERASWLPDRREEYHNDVAAGAER